MVSFARDIVPVLEKHCTGKDCHGDQPTVNIALDLRRSAAYRQLVNVPSETGTSHLMRVKPGAPDASMLLHKLTGNLGFKEGKQMPIDADTGEPLAPSPLPAGFASLLSEWIRAGAPDN